MSDSKTRNIARKLIDEKAAADVLGISVHGLRKDRQTRSIGVPFHRFGEGRRCTVRYESPTWTGSVLSTGSPDGVAP